MYKLKKTFLLFLVAVLVFGLSACRKKDPPKKLQTFDGVELTYYKMFDDSDAIEPIIQKYIAAHPGLTIKYKKFDNFDEYQRVILNEMAEGEGPDIFSMQNTWFTSNYKKINPMPLEFGSPEEFAQVFVDVAYKDLVRTNDEGIEGVYGLPMTVDTLALYYNKAHFEDRIPKRGRPSDTWEGIKEDVVLLNKEDNSFERFEVAGIALGRADNIQRGVDALYLMMLQHGVKFYNDNISEAVFAGQQGGISSYPGLAALELLASFADQDQKHYSWNKYLVDEYGQKEVEAFARGKVSMVLGFSYLYNDIVNEINVLKASGVQTIDLSDIRVAQAPQLFDPDISTDKRVTYANYFAETVSRNSEHPDIAWDFLLELTKKENLQFYFDKLKKPTSRRDMINDQKKDPTYGVFAAQIGFAESFPILDYFKYKEIFTDVLTQINDGRGGRSDLVDAQDEITKMLPPGGLLQSKIVVEKDE